VNGDSFKGLAAVEGYELLIFCLNLVFSRSIKIYLKKLKFNTF
jgi:hypothetical protein